MSKPFSLKVAVQAEDDQRVLELTGRAAWALHELHEAGARGCTPIDTPGPRWSHYVWLLKHEHQIGIETIHEAHGGTFSGTHARYVLRTPLEVLEVEDPRRPNLVAVQQERAAS